MTPLLEQVGQYLPLDSYEAQMARRLQRFLETADPIAVFSRDLAGNAPEWGHVTGSAWVVNRSFSRVVLLHHGKLNIWVQPGGHCDGESNVLGVAGREATEETGLHVTPHNTRIFDIDVHRIPEYSGTPAHLHFDVRYIFVADENQTVVCSHESKAVRWMTLEEAEELSGEESIARMIRKTRSLQHIAPTSF